jgi:hypothetical protein
MPNNDPKQPANLPETYEISSGGYHARGVSTKFLDSLKPKTPPIGVNKPVGDNNHDIPETGSRNVPVVSNNNNDVVTNMNARLTFPPSPQTTPLPPNRTAFGSDSIRTQATPISTPSSGHADPMEFEIPPPSTTGKNNITKIGPPSSKLEELKNFVIAPTSTARDIAVYFENGIAKVNPRKTPVYFDHGVPTIGGHNTPVVSNNSNVPVVSNNNNVPANQDPSQQASRNALGNQPTYGTLGQSAQQSPLQGSSKTSTDFGRGRGRGR